MLYFWEWRKSKLQPWLQPGRSYNNTVNELKITPFGFITSIINAKEQCHQQSQKTHSDKFPLTLHKTGQYCKKNRGKIYYFGTDAQIAIQRYLNKLHCFIPGKDQLLKMPTVGLRQKDNTWHPELSFETHQREDFCKYLKSLFHWAIDHEMIRHAPNSKTILNQVII